MPADLTQDILNSDLILQAVRAFPNPELQVEETLNDSDKTFTIPSTEIWQILYIRCELDTSATGGDRKLVIHVRDDDDDILYSIRPHVSQANVGGRNYNFAPGNPLETDFYLNEILTPIPNLLFLLPSYSLRIYDSAAIDPTADDLTIQMMVNRYDV